ncbi:MAG: arylsulfatase, partial [Armatimonadota bacterium]
FEMSGNRGIYHKGWTAGTRHRIPWITAEAVLPAFDDDNWELYDTSKDWAQARDLAKENPGKLYELQRLWLIQAAKYNVLPLDDRFVELADPDLAGRPQIVRGARQLLFGGMGRLCENAIINYKNRSHAVTAEVVVPASGAEGVIAAVGGIIGGWSLYCKGGKPNYFYNFFGVKHFRVESKEAIPAGTHQVRIEFAYDGGGIGLGGAVTLYLDGQIVGDGRVERTHPALFSADETFDIGRETGSPVSPDYIPRKSKFSGEVNWVEIDLGDAAHDADHYISHEERYRIAMALQ